MYSGNCPKAANTSAAQKGVQLSRNKPSLSRLSGIKLEDKQSVEPDLPSGKQQDAEKSVKILLQYEVVGLKEKKKTRLIETLWRDEHHWKQGYPCLSWFIFPKEIVFDASWRLQRSHTVQTASVEKPQFCLTSVKLLRAPSACSQGRAGTRNRVAARALSRR